MEWTIELQDSDTRWRRFHIVRGNDTVAILDEMLCSDAEQLAEEIVEAHNGK